jgi:predicted  nucleic acid-binding Zn-ribbon protein
VDSVERLDVAISETETRLSEVETRVAATRERFGKARATLDDERNRISSDVASLDAELAAVRARRKKEESSLAEVRERIARLEAAADDGLTDELAEAYEEAASGVRLWRETRSAEQSIEERVDERKGELRDLVFQIEQLVTNRDQSLARLEGTAKGLRMVLGEQLQERSRLCEGLVEQTGG